VLASDPAHEEEGRRDHDEERVGQCRENLVDRVLDVRGRVAGGRDRAETISLLCPPLRLTRPRPQPTLTGTQQKTRQIHFGGYSRETYADSVTSDVITTRRRLLDRCSQRVWRTRSIRSLVW